MDTYEATKVVMSRIQSLDRENASKIMGYILIQGQGEKEIIRLAFLPESLLLSYINQAKARLGIPPNPPVSNPSTSLSNPMTPNNPFPQTSPRISIPTNGFHFSNPTSPATAALRRTSPRPFSYAAALNGGGNNSPSNILGSSILPFSDEADPIMSPSGKSDSLVFVGEDANGVVSPHPFHRRSCSVNDAAFLEDGGGGLGWRPCMYFARGFCKNGSSCKFLHGEMGEIEVGSPSNSSYGIDELLRMKAMAALHQRLAPRHHPFGFNNKCMDFLNETPRNEFSPMGLGANSSSRQIYLTFPADSSFKEEDVSNYFSMFGPVQDVRIPYQQKRMFGFVTFVYPETVKLILAKGNPHFVCDSRVLVKPYKEKGKVLEKRQHQQHHLDLSPSGIERTNLPFGSRMLLSSQEMMLRRKLEQDAELQHAVDLQGQWMMNSQLMDLKNQAHDHPFLQGFMAGIPISSPRQSQLVMNRNFLAPFDSMKPENSLEFDGRQEAAKSPDQKLAAVETQYNNASGNKHHDVNSDDSDLPESFLPNNLFASPTKLAAEHRSIFNQASASTDDSIPVASSNSTTPAMPGSGMSSLKLCYSPMPRFSSGQEAIEM